MSARFMRLVAAVTLITTLNLPAEAADTKTGSTSGTKCDARESAGNALDGIMGFMRQWAGGESPRKAPTAEPRKASGTVKPKMVSVLFTTRTVYEGETITPSCVSLRQVELGQLPKDAIKTTTLSHPPNGLNGWQARYTLAEGTLVSYQALGPGRWSCSRGQWTYGSHERISSRRTSRRSF